MAEALTFEDARRRFRRLLLDTSVLIDEFKHPTGRLRDINRAQRATSTVALWEFLHEKKGALLSVGERGDRRAWLKEEGVVQLPISTRGSRSFESLLNAEGPPEVADALLAAECLALGVPIVTRNVKDFEAVRGLRYVAW